MPTFSVVIAAYQAAEVIGTAIASALEQEPPPLEVIVGDDGSTDDLAGAVAPFASAVRVVRIEHGGEAAAKNAAAGAATGDVLAFLDADDRFLPGRLAAIAARFDEDPTLDAVTTDAWLVHGGEVLGRCYGEQHRFVADDQRVAILRRNFVLGLAAIRRPVFDALGGFDPTIRHTTDWDLWVRLIHGGSRVGFIDEPLAEYRLHPASMSANRAAMSRGRLETLARALSRGGLTDEERAVALESQRLERAVLRWEELKAALRDGRSVRPAAARVVTGPDHPLAARAKAALALAAPRLVARQQRSATGDGFETVGGRRLARR